METLKVVGQVVGMLAFFGLMAALPAIGKALWYAIKVWFTTKIVKSTWKGK